MPSKDEFPIVLMDGEADPDRCQGIAAHGQCRHKAIPGRKFCVVHIGNSLRLEEKKSLRNYRITKWQARLEEFADNPQVKSLREEIGLLRMVLEEIGNSCTDQMSLVMNANRIGDLVMKIEKLVSSCHRLEKSTGMLLDKSAAIQLAAKFVEIIANEIEDPEAIDRISSQMITEISTMTIVEKEEK